jgi:hypothetical protein
VCVYIKAAAEAKAAVDKMPSYGVSRSHPPRRIWRRVRRYAKTKRERTLEWR